MSSIRKVRLLADYEGRQLSLCKILFTAADASVYFIPYAANRRFFCGGRTMRERQLEDTFHYATESPEERGPKLSIHQSGQVHVLSGETRVGPLQSHPLPDLRGEHVATVCFDRFEGLPIFDGPPALSGSEIDHTIPVEEGAHSGRLAVYVNGNVPSFADGTCRLTFTLTRRTLQKPLHVGVKPIAQAPLGEPMKPGVTVLAGWNPTLADDSKQDYLYIRAE